MSISIIVPNYNGIGLLANCLCSLRDHDRKPDQIIVVDNGSSDGSPDILRRDFPFVDLVSLETNTGFTGANNAGLQAANGDLIVLLNNDCVVEKGWLSNLEKRMEDCSVAAATSSMRNITDLGIMDSAGGEIDWMGFSRDIGKGLPASSFRHSMELPFPCGGAVMVRRSALPDPSILFWNELFIYQEDLDLGFELLRSGWKVVYEPNAVVRHMHSATTGRGSFFKEHLCIRNRLLVLRKHFDGEAFKKLNPVVRKWQNLWLLASIIRGRLTLAKSILIGTRDGLTLPVTPFISEMPVNDVFISHAKDYDASSKVKKNMYGQMKKLIEEHSCE